MDFYKKFSNGLRLVGTKIEGVKSVSFGVVVNTGSSNETEENNGISHFIEHTVFKGTGKRSALDISSEFEAMGTNFNAFTSKTNTCYYFKSTSEHLIESVDVLSDIFFNATFKKEDLKKEKDVIIEEIKINEDSFEDVCFDVLASKFYGEQGFGRTILGTVKNVRRFTDKDIYEYMDKYYTADNVVVSVAGDIDENTAIDIVKKYFVDKFTRLKHAPIVNYPEREYGNGYRYKKTEQAHIAFAFDGYKITDPMAYAFNVMAIAFGGGMSSRLFQRIREDLGLCYTVYSTATAYRDFGVCEIYAGVKQTAREDAAKAIMEEINKVKEKGLTEKEFLAGREQLKSSYIMARESTSSQMLKYAKNILNKGKLIDFEKELKTISNVKIKDVNEVAKTIFDFDKMAVATCGRARTPIKI